MNLPFVRYGRIEFEYFDLNTTWYKTPTALFSRNRGFSEQEQDELIASYKRVLQCLQKKDQNH